MGMLFRRYIEQSEEVVEKAKLEEEKTKKKKKRSK